MIYRNKSTGGVIEAFQYKSTFDLFNGAGGAGKMNAPSWFIAAVEETRIGLYHEHLVVTAVSNPSAKKSPTDHRRLMPGDYVGVDYRSLSTDVLMVFSQARFESDFEPVTANETSVSTPKINPLEELQEAQTAAVANLLLAMQLALHNKDLQLQIARLEAEREQNCESGKDPLAGVTIPTVDDVFNCDGVSSYMINLNYPRWQTLSALGKKGNFVTLTRDSEQSTTIKLNHFSWEVGGSGHTAVARFTPGRHPNAYDLVLPGDSFVEKCRCVETPVISFADAKRSISLKEGETSARFIKVRIDASKASSSPFVLTRLTISPRESGGELYALCESRSEEWEAEVASVSIKASGLPVDPEHSFYMRVPKSESSNDFANKIFKSLNAWYAPAIANKEEE